MRMRAVHTIRSKATHTTIFGTMRLIDVLHNVLVRAVEERTQLLNQRTASKKEVSLGCALCGAPTS